jgi:hypothetical protein
MAVTYTNNHGLPEHIFKAIIQDDHVVNGDISVTQLIGPPQIRILKRNNDYEMDAMDLVPAFMGTGLHTVLERADTGHRDAIAIRRAITTLAGIPGQEKVIEYLKDVVEKHIGEKLDDNVMKEVNLTLKINGMIVSGTFDRYQKDTEHLQDYKQCKAIQFTFPEFMKTWKYQLNTYAVMLREEGIGVKKITVHPFFKDWSKIHTLRDRSYPKHIYVAVDIPIADHDRMMNYLRGRVDLHRRAEQGEPIYCTAEERWQKADVYKIMKVGNTKSTKNLPSPELAEAFIEEKKLKDPVGKYNILFVPGESTRCAGYCPVSHLCPQYKEELKMIAEKSANYSID